MKMKQMVWTLLPVMMFAFASCKDGIEPAEAAPQTGTAVETQGTEECPLSFPKQGLCASLTWQKESTDEETGEFTLRFWNEKEATEAGPFVDPAYPVSVKLWMPSMGHGSSPVKVAQSVGQDGTKIPGVYSATEVHFVMGGEWEIWVEFKKDKKIIERAKVDYAL